MVNSVRGVIMAVIGAMIVLIKLVMAMTKVMITSPEIITVMMRVVMISSKTLFLFLVFMGVITLVRVATPFITGTMKVVILPMDFVSQV